MPGSLLRRSAVAVLLLLALPTIAGAVWIEEGPGPQLNGSVEGIPDFPVAGAVAAIAFNPNNSAIAYLGTVNGGVWKSNNANDANPGWRPLTDTRLPALSINAIALSPLDANIVFAGTGSTSSNALEGSPGFGVLRSRDGGLTWSILARQTFAGRRITSIVPTAFSETGLFDQQVVLVSTSFDTGGGVWRSSNGGASFALVSGVAGTGLPAGRVSSIVADPTDARRSYAAIASGVNAGVYRTEDAGLTWTRASTGISGLASSLRILLSAGRTTGVLYAMVLAESGKLGGIFRSANQGGQWTALPAPPIDLFTASQGIIHGAIAAHPSNPNVVFVGGDSQDAPFPSPSGCNRFTATFVRADVSLASPWQNAVCTGANGTSPHSDARSIAFDASGRLVVTNDGGVFRLETPDETTRRWSSINGNLRSNEFNSVAYDALTKTVFGGTQDNGSPMQNSPGNHTWTNFINGDGGVVAVDDDQVAHPGTSIRYTSAQSIGNFNRSTWDANNVRTDALLLQLLIQNGPRAGQQLGADPTVQFYTPYVLNAIDKRRLLIGTATIYESSDRGDTLTDLGGSTRVINAIVYGGRKADTVNPGVFYVGYADCNGCTTALLRRRPSDASAVTDVTRYPGSGVRAIATDPTDHDRVFVADAQGRIWTSTDAGNSWDDETENLRDFSTDIRALALIRTPAGHETLVAGGAGGVFDLPRAEAPGARLWRRLSTGFPHSLVMDLRYHAIDDVLLAGTLGRGAWTLRNFFGGGAAAAAATAGAISAARSAARSASAVPNVSGEPFPPMRAERRPVR